MSDSIPVAIKNELARLAAADVEHDKNIALLDQRMTTLAQDVKEFREGQEAMIDKLDDIRERALSQWPPYASLLVTVLAMLVAGLATAIFTR